MSLNLSNIKKRLEQEELRLKFNSLLKSYEPEEVRKMLIDCLASNDMIIFNFPINQDSLFADTEQTQQQEYREDIFSIRNKTQLPIDVPTNMTTIFVDGKTYNIDLVKISKWTLDNLPKQLRIYKAGMEQIKETLSNLTYEQIKLREDNILETIGSLYWNITIYFDKVDFKDFKSKETKRVYQLLSIFYGILHTIKTIDRTELFGDLLKEYQISKNTTDFYFAKFKSILKNSFISELLDYQTEIPEQIDEFETEVINEIMEKLVDDKILSKDVFTFGAIAFYIEQLKGKTTYLSSIQKKLNIPNISKLNKTYSIVVNYINKNKYLKRKILRRI